MASPKSACAPSPTHLLPSRLPSERQIKCNSIRCRFAIDKNVAQRIRPVAGQVALVGDVVPKSADAKSVLMEADARAKVQQGIRILLEARNASGIVIDRKRHIVRPVEVAGKLERRWSQGGLVIGPQVGGPLRCTRQRPSAGVDDNV